MSGRIETSTSKTASEYKYSKNETIGANEAGVDIGADPQGGSESIGFNYSTEEQVGGTWINGDTWYYKTVATSSNVSVNDSSFVRLPLDDEPENIAVLIGSEIHDMSPTHWLVLRFNVSNGHIMVAGKTSDTLSKGTRFTFKYIKTT